MLSSISCSQDIDDNKSVPGGDNAGTRTTDYSVRDEDIDAYLEMYPYCTYHPTCTPYPSKSAPLLYIVNYSNDSWQLISSDKRTVPILACGAGNLDMHNCNPDLAACIDAVAMEIKALHSYSDKVHHSDWPESFWQIIADPEQLLPDEDKVDLMLDYLTQSHFASDGSPVCHIEDNAVTILQAIEPKNIELMQKYLLEQCGIESFRFSFNDPGLRAYEEIRYQVLDGTPVAVYVRDKNSGDTYSYIINRVSLFSQKDELTFHNRITLKTDSRVLANVHYYFNVCFGQGGSEDNVWFADPSDWYLPQFDDTGREALTAFRKAVRVETED